MRNGSSGPGPGIMIDEGENAHEILGLPRNASGAEVREAYIRLAKEYHPDTHPDDPVAERRFKRITKAYNELRSSFRVLGGARTYRAPKYWGSYRQVLASAVLFFVLAPLAFFLFLRSGERSVPAPELTQAEGTASPRSGDDGGTAPERIAALNTDGVAEAPTISPEKRSSDVSADVEPVAPSRGGLAEGGRFRRTASFEAHSSQGIGEAQRYPETAPPGEGRTSGVQTLSPRNGIAIAPADGSAQPSDQDDETKVSSVQKGMQDKHEAAVELQAPPNEAAGGSGKKSVVPPKTIDTAALHIPGDRQRMKPQQHLISARAGVAQHALDRTVLTAAPGG
ncbi:MAG: J domain-containing protein [Rhodomicrobium sp.]